jgi:hypothetical protein
LAAGLKLCADDHHRKGNSGKYRSEQKSAAPAFPVR